MQLRKLAVLASLVLVACGPDATAPVLAPTWINARFESEEVIPLPNGKEAYFVGVYIEGPSDGYRPMYLVQIGVREGSSASLAMHQNTYDLMGNQIFFHGGVLGVGTISPDSSTLSTSFWVDGEQIYVTLPRLP